MTVTIDDVIKARHSSNFQDVLLEYLVTLDTEMVNVHRCLAGLEHLPSPPLSSTVGEILQPPDPPAEFLGKE